MIYVKDTKHYKSVVVENVVRLFNYGELDFVQLVLFCISVWFEIELDSDDGITVYTLDRQSNTAAQIHHGCRQGYDYVFIGLDYNRYRFGYIIFEDEDY